VRPHVVVVGASLAVAIGTLLQGGAFARTPVIAVAQEDAVPVADVVLQAPVDALELIATVRLLVARRTAAEGGRGRGGP
jgi:hypothetical protein